jgi:ABC-type Mn2+/Zn2+ transport system permease subunit
LFATSARAAPATLPASAASAPAMDTGTRHALSDIDAVASPQGGATSGAAPAAQPKTSAGRPTGEWDWWQQRISFFWPVLLTAGAIGVAASIMGLFVLLRREALLALALPQVVAVGAAVGMRLGMEHTLPPALATALAGLVFLVILKRRGGGTTSVPALYVAGLSLSFLILAGAQAHVEELQKLFTGVDVAVYPERAVVAAPILLAAALAAAALWRRWLLLAQAPAAAELAGVHPARWDASFLALLTLVLLLGTDSQGVVMVLAMLFLPAAAVLPWARRIPGAMAAAALLSLVLVAVAFYLSNRFNWPLSQSVGGVGFAAMIVSNLLARRR